MNEFEFEYFICFRGNARSGGAVAERVYNTVHNILGKKCFFSSAAERTRGGNYREDEINALKTCGTVFVILTDGFIEGLTVKDDEVLFELLTVLPDKDKKLITVAEDGFAFTEERKRILMKTLPEESANRLIFNDFIRDLGVRDYSNFTEKLIFDVLGISQDTSVIRRIDELADTLLRFQVEFIENEENAAIRTSSVSSLDSPIKFNHFLRINGKKTESDPADAVLNAINDGAKKIFLIGGSGMGKTTVMRCIYKSLYSNRDNPIPVFVSLTGATEFFSDKTKLIKSSLAKLGIKCAPEIVESFARLKKFVFLIDSVDEKSDALGERRLTSEMNGASNDDVFIYSCRSNFFATLRNVASDRIIEMLPLTKEQTENYCRSYLLSLDAEENNIETIVKFISEQEILNNPLFISYFLLYAESYISAGGVDKMNSVKILKIIVENLLKRESDKKEDFPPLKQTLIILGLAAFETRKFTVSGASPDYTLMLSRVKSALSDMDENIIKNVTDVFVIENSFLNEYRFIHMMFCEYFNALYFTNALFERRHLADILYYGFSSETNAFIAEIFNLYGRRESLELLKRAYNETEPDEYDAKLQILNHMHRTSLYPDIKMFAKSKLNSESDEVNKILLLHTLLAVGGNLEEEEYYAKLNADEDFALLNAGITLRYYAGVEYGLRAPYYDDGSIPWYPCFLAYKKHLTNSGKIAHYNRVKRMNLFTARTFIRLRQRADKEVADFFYSLKDAIYKDDSEWGQKVATEYEKLIKTIEQYADYE